MAGIVEPSNVVAWTYHAPYLNGIYLGGDQRAASFGVATDGIIVHGSPYATNGFDTCCGDPPTTFAGLIYGQQEQFNQVTMQMGPQYGDGGNFLSTPSLYLLINPVDTNTTSPVGNSNWVQVTGFTVLQDSNGTLPGGSDGGSYVFDLTGLRTSLRDGYGWAMVGPGTGTNRFISITELQATGVNVPEPSSLILSAVGAVVGLGLIARRRPCCLRAPAVRYAVTSLVPVRKFP